MAIDFNTIGLPFVNFIKIASSDDLLSIAISLVFMNVKAERSI